MDRRDKPADDGKEEERAHCTALALRAFELPTAKDVYPQPTGADCAMSGSVHLWGRMNAN
jgi:hypothetical protein